MALGKWLKPDTLDAPTLTDWFEELQSKSRTSIPHPVQVVGTYRVHHDASYFAEVEILAEPSTEWSVELGVSVDDYPELQSWGLLSAIVFGLYDVLAVDSVGRPLLDLRIKIIGLKIDPVGSSWLAFRMAGRKAAEQILIPQAHVVEM